MTNKIPPSLNWLIKKHARLSGQLIRTKKRLKAVLPLVDLLKKLEFDLDHVEKTLALHEIKINTDYIKPVRPRNLRLELPRGFVLKFVFDYLKEHSQNRLVEKSEMVEALKVFYQSKYSTMPAHVKFTDSISSALHINLKAGRVVRCHNLITSDIGLWQLAEYHNNETTSHIQN
jgi:hypothetical protein